MKKLHNEQSSKINFHPKEEEQASLCSNNQSIGSSSLGFKSNSPFVTDEMLLDYFASIIVSLCIEDIEHDDQQ